MPNPGTSGAEMRAPVRINAEIGSPIRNGRSAYLNLDALERVDAFLTPSRDQKTMSSVINGKWTLQRP
jgi:hypothetical protein